MENASKALIIAGAILLSIAIIGVGMFVYNSVSGTITDAADMTQQEIADILHINRRTYSAYENGVNAMTPETSRATWSPSSTLP